VLFVAGAAALAISPEFGARPGIAGLIVSLMALSLGRKNVRAMVLEFDWNSFLFITGAVMVIFTVNTYGLLSDFAELVVRPGFDNPTLVLTFTIWISVTLSSFIDNAPFTILTIPVCQHLARLLQISAWPLRYDHGCRNRR
jgi:Na+/H+ antiporter NhaD/arsenite permease-like protein